jgi:hypothetical protein
LLHFTADERQEERWKLREELLLAEVERDIQVDLQQTLHLENVSAAQYSGGNDIFEYYWGKARERFIRYSNLVLPYSKHSTVSTAQTLREAWTAAWGDPNDPEVAASIQRTSDYLKKQGNRDA